MRRAGKPHAEGLPVSATGLIPAWAGKTYGSHTLTVPSWAHPRVGGENELMAFATSSFVGSSPRGRGKQIDLDWEDAGPGLIPARAGKTHHDQDQTVRLPAHPRAGGENVVEPVWTNVSTGSSPRGRGKHVLLECRHLAVRLIPARAGKTLRASRMWRHRRAHPRAGGENS